ncbi:hypothetical protein LX36DRAFT_368110 [Colletotrichum falcatum]|nr:hypothetical protein LX36DRAFT_368110 [Colletotrichum falcatum]
MRFSVACSPEYEMETGRGPTLNGVRIRVLVPCVLPIFCRGRAALERYDTYLPPSVSLKGGEGGSRCLITYPDRTLPTYLGIYGYIIGRYASCMRSAPQENLARSGTIRTHYPNDILIPVSCPSTLYLPWVVNAFWIELVSFPTPDSSSQRPSSCGANPIYLFIEIGKSPTASLDRGPGRPSCPV